jgi:hypothetical protein
MLGAERQQSGFLGWRREVQEAVMQLSMDFSGQVGLAPVRLPRKKTLNEIKARNISPRSVVSKQQGNQVSCLINAAEKGSKTGSRGRSQP